MSPNLQETTDLVTLTAKILNEKFHFLCSVTWKSRNFSSLKLRPPGVEQS